MTRIQTRRFNCVEFEWRHRFSSTCIKYFCVGRDSSDAVWKITCISTDDRWQVRSTCWQYGHWRYVRLPLFLVAAEVIGNIALVGATYQPHHNARDWITCRESPYRFAARCDLPALLRQGAMPLAPHALSSCQFFLRRRHIYCCHTLHVGLPHDPQHSTQVVPQLTALASGLRQDGSTCTHLPSLC